jgi:hypothetical protein
MRRSIVGFLGDAAVGKTDAFLALLTLGLDLIKPGGFLLYVLPHSFLLARNAEQIRKRIRATCVIRMIVDLSQVPVFEGVGSYVILLVLEMRGPHTLLDQSAVVVRCRDAVGEALQAALDGRTGSQAGYSVYQLGQEAFDGETWELLSPQQFALKQRLQSLPRLGDIAEIREGVVTGADEVFIRLSADVPHDQRGIFPPLLTDREMQRFSTPPRTQYRVFYPFADGVKLSADDLKRRYHETWRYLTKHEDVLRKQASVVKGTVEWWAPERPRTPKHILRPKIVAPHLMLVPRFGVDSKGKFVVTRSPVIYPKDQALEKETLFLLCAILNSPLVHWQLTLSSHRYSRGYLMLEPKTLRNIRIPDLGRLPQRDVTQIAQVVEGISPKSVEGDERILNDLVTGAYGFTVSELVEFGLM